MATTRRPNVISHTAAGDTSTGRFLVSQLIWNGSSSAGDDLEIKDSTGTLLLKVKSDGTQVVPIAWPFGEIMVDGIETDVLDAGTVEYILE
jgi:hypothetical protein